MCTSEWSGYNPAFHQLPSRSRAGPAGWQIVAKLQMYLWLGLIKHKKYYPRWLATLAFLSPIVFMFQWHSQWVHPIRWDNECWDTNLATTCNHLLHRETCTIFELSRQIILILYCSSFSSEHMFTKLDLSLAQITPVSPTLLRGLLSGNTAAQLRLEHIVKVLLCS